LGDTNNRDRYREIERNKREDEARIRK
jgi:hypothetical protein